jgi:hypothetical protein
MMEENLAVPFKTTILGVDVTMERIDLNEAEEIVAYASEAESALSGSRIFKPPALSEVRGMISWVVRETKHLSLTELSQRLNRDISSLSVAARRLVERSKFENHLARKMEELKAAL